MYARNIGLHLLPGDPTFNLTDFSPSEVFDNNKSVLNSFGIQTNNDELDFPTFIAYPRCTKIPTNTDLLRVHRSVRPSFLSALLTKLLSHIKQGLQKYCETAYSRSGINQMWIVKNSKELLEHLKSPNFKPVNSIKSFDLSTLNTTIPHQKLKRRLETIIRNSFI